MEVAQGWCVGGVGVVWCDSGVEVCVCVHVWLMQMLTASARSLPNNRCNHKQRFTFCNMHAMSIPWIARAWKLGGRRGM